MLALTFFLGLAIFSALPGQAQITITRTSSPIFYLDTSSSLHGMYVAYDVYNGTGTSYDDVWVQIGSFSGSIIGLAPKEDGLYHLGALGAGATKPVFFFLQATAATTAETHTVSVYDTKPPATALATANFSMTAEETISANANKVTTTVATPNPGLLGGIITITVTGQTGTIGNSKILSFTPAASTAWEAGSYKLVSTTITLTVGNTGTFVNDLFFTVPNSVATDYTAVYTFRAAGISTAPTAVSPVGYIASGNQIKHTSTTNFGTLDPILPADNKTTLTKAATPTTVIGGGLVTYTLTLTNSGSDAVTVDEIIDTLPTSPATPTYQTGSATYNGSGINDPVVSGNTLSWFRTFAVPAGGSVDLTFQVSLPATNGTYTNTAVGCVGAEQIDTTLDTSDDAPATAAVGVDTDSDGDGIPDGDEDANGNSNPADDDADGDGIPNYLDIDSDNDGLIDTVEAGPDPTNPVDTDSDGLPDYLDVDADGDGIPDNVEAQSTAGFQVPSGVDVDGDGLDDAYDANTGSTDPAASAGLTPYDYDADTTPDYLDADSDDDGSPDSQEGHDYDHDGTPDLTPSGNDTDGDGLDDAYEDSNGYTPGHVSNPNNGFTGPATELPKHGDPSDDIDFRNNLVLPVELVAFDAVADGPAAVLRWRTASETNNAGFEVHRRNAARPIQETGWVVLGFVAGYGTTEVARSYTFRIDDLAPGLHRFRLKQIDYDGTFDYSPEVEIAVGMEAAFILEPVYPNPFNGDARFRFAPQRTQHMQIVLFDALGRQARLLFDGLAPAGQLQEVRIDGNGLPAGSYFVRVTGTTFRRTRAVTVLR